MFNLSNFAFTASDIPGKFQLKREFDPENAHPQMEYEDGKPTGEMKLVDGREVYRVPAQYFDEYGIDDNVSLRVFTVPRATLPAMSAVRLIGRVRPVAYVKNGRVAYSLIADSIAVDGGETDD